MRILLIVQRYGSDVVGGSERAARGFAQHLAARGHEVTVATSAAKSYVTWAPEFEAGASSDGLVEVIRFAAPGPRSSRFDDLHVRVLGSAALGDPLPLPAQRGWMHEIGPALIGWEEWLIGNVSRFDLAVIFTFQYATAWRAGVALRGLLPIVMHPTAHPELTLELEVFDELFAAMSGLAYLTPEEQTLVERRFGHLVGDAETTVCGVGMDLLGAPDPAAVVEFRTRFAVHGRPYVVCVGRIDRGKGTAQLAAMHAALAARGLIDAVLVVIGDQGTSEALIESDRICVTGVLSDSEVHAAISGSAALVQPSPHESFSIVLCEAAACGRPVLVTGLNDVLVGQVKRSRGGLWYRDAVEYGVMLNALCRADGPGVELGLNGRHWVEETYRWDRVIDEYELFLDRVRSRWTSQR